MVEQVCRGEDVSRDNSGGTKHYSLIIMLMVVMLNSVLLPFTRADCSSWGVMDPDLLESTLNTFAVETLDYL